MIVRKAYKYRLRVRQKHLSPLFRYAGCQRFVWNHFLDRQKKLLDTGDRCLSYADMCKELTALKSTQEHSFLAEVPSQTLQQTLKDLSRAIKDCFSKKKKFPRFKKRGVGDSFRFPQGVKIEGNAVCLPRLGWVKLFSSQNVQGKICNTTVRRRGKHWFVSVQVEQVHAEPKHSSKSSVGIDLGVARFATLSTGEYFVPLNSFDRLEKKLAREQRRLSRKTRFSSNWRKQKYRVEATHIRIADARRDYLHKLSTSISKNHAVIVIEDLRVSQMSSGRVSRLNRRILDQGWYEFRRQLEYKQLWQGGQVIAVDPCNTSRTCLRCRHVAQENRKSQSEFCCVSCGYGANADFVAACNILISAVGHTVSACGDTKPVAA